jgi:iron complex outermembrane recepter protein
MQSKYFNPRPVACAIHLACAAMAGFALPQVAFAQAAQNKIQYDIPAGSLGEALNRFAQQSGVSIAVDASKVQGLKSSGLRGSYGVEEGFNLLLQGSGYTISKNAAGYLLVPAAVSSANGTTLPEVKVSAKAEQESTLNLQSQISGGALGSRSQLETPFSTAVVTREELADRQVSKLGDVFALDASVTDNSGAYTSWASYVTVRGLELDWQNSFRIDGKPFLSYAITLPYEHFEQIELLKGSSGFMYGFGSPGGLINYVTKKPTNEPVRSVEVGFKSKSIWSESVDLGGRFGNDNMFGYRLNAVNEKGTTYNDGKIDRQSVSLGLDARLTPDLTLTFDSLYQKRNNRGQQPGISLASYTGTVLPNTIKNNNSNLVSGGQFLNTEFQFYSVGLKYQIVPDWSASINYSQTSSLRSRNEGILYLQNVAGNYNEARSDTKEGHKFDQWQAMLEGKAITGNVEHQMVFGASWQKQLNDYSSNGVWIPTLYTGNIYTANTASYASQGGLNMYRAGDISQQAAFASDTLKFSDQWSVLAGARYTKYEQNDYNVNGSLATPAYADSVVTPTVALMYKAQPNTMIYTSYMESLEPGRTVGAGFSNSNRMLNPMLSKQYEIGMKTEQARWSGTAALFRIERPSEYVDATNTVVQNGESSYQGLELGVSGFVGTQWQLASSLMLLDTSYDKGVANVGKRVVGAPEWMATGRVIYKVPGVDNLKLMADFKYTGDVMINAANTLKADSHVLANFGASYSMKMDGYLTTFRAAVNNVTNEKFWEYQYANWIKPADPRTFSLSAKVDF